MLPRAEAPAATLRSLPGGARIFFAGDAFSAKSRPQEVEWAMDRYVCLMCGFIYDPKKGDLAGGLAPGTDFSQAGADWRCPRCGAPERNFARKEEDD